MPVGFGDRRAHVIDQGQRRALVLLTRRRVLALQEQTLGARRGDQRQRRQMHVTINVFDRLQCVIKLIKEERQSDTCAQRKEQGDNNIALARRPDGRAR